MQPIPPAASSPVDFYPFVMREAQALSTDNATFQLGTYDRDLVKRSIATISAKIDVHQDPFLGPTIQATLELVQKIKAHKTLYFKPYCNELLALNLSHLLHHSVAILPTDTGTTIFIHQKPLPVMLTDKTKKAIRVIDVVRLVFDKANNVLSAESIIKGSVNAFECPVTKQHVKDKRRFAIMQGLDQANSPYFPHNFAYVAYQGRHCKKFAFYQTKANGGDLHTYATETKQPCTLPVETRASMIGNIVEALLLMHQYGYVHRDLKTENVLVTCRQPGRAQDRLVAEQPIFLQVTDFDCSCKLEDTAALQERIGTFAWVAPEVIQDKLCNRTTLYDGLALDSWGAGLVIHSIENSSSADIQYAAQALDDGKKDAEEAWNLEVSLLNKEISTYTSHQDLADGCMHREPRTRWTLQKVKQKLSTTFQGSIASVQAADMTTPEGENKRLYNAPLAPSP